MNTKGYKCPSGQAQLAGHLDPQIRPDHMVLPCPAVPSSPKIPNLLSSQGGAGRGLRQLERRSGWESSPAGGVLCASARFLTWILFVLRQAAQFVIFLNSHGGAGRGEVTVRAVGAAACCVYLIWILLVLRQPPQFVIFAASRAPSANGRCIPLGVSPS
jgi:hypothetical protein